MFLTIGILLLLAAGYLFLIGHLLPGIVVIAVSAFFIFQDLRSLFAGKRITSLTYSSFIDHATRQIDAGRTSIKKEVFLSEMEKIKDVLSTVQFVPVVGFDSVYIQYSSENAANNALALIHERGLKVDIIQDKSTWSVRIQFPSTSFNGS